MRHALERGVNWIDTAAVYGLGHSEQVVRWLLCELPPGERPLVFTKCGLIWDQNNPMAPPRRVLKPGSIRRECRDSLRRLGVERIDLYQFHWPDETGTPVEDSWREMVRLIEEGKVRLAGVSNFDVSLLERCEAIRHVDSLQPPFSLIRRQAAAREIPWCAKHNTGVICYSPMQSGLLTDTFSRERVARFAEDDWRRRSPDFQRAEPEPQSGLARRPTPDRATSSHHGVRGSGRLGAGLARRYRRHCWGPLTPAGRRLDRCVPATDRSRLAGDFRCHRSHRRRRGPNDPAIGACRYLALESGSTELSQTLALFFLFTTPIIYLYLDRLQNRLVRPRK
jgi:Aldo/keto reductase family